MIKDKLKYAETYYGLSEGIKRGLEWLKNEDLETIADGRYDIVGKKLYANVQTYQTKEDADYEAHREYIDIQYVVKGKEFVGVCDLADCITCIEYDAEKDIEFLKYNKSDEYQTLNEGEFLILYTTDAHKPSISPNERLIVKKVVVKVAIN